jgi:hypothetical protein
MTQRHEDIQSVKDIIVPGDEYAISEIQELTKLSHPRVLHAVANSAKTRKSMFIGLKR